MTPSQGGREFMQTIQEMKKLDLSRVPLLAEQKYDPKQTVGLVLDFEQLWYFTTLAQARRWNQPAWLKMWYGAFARLGIRVKILRPGTDWPSDLPIIVAPSLQMTDPKLIEQFDSYAKGGGAFGADLPYGF